MACTRAPEPMTTSLVGLIFALELPMISVPSPYAWAFTFAETSHSPLADILIAPTLLRSAFPTWTLARSLAVSMLEYAPSPDKPPPAVKVTLSSSIKSLYAFILKLPGVAMLPTTSREVPSPTATRVVKLSMVPLSALPPATIPPASPCILEPDSCLRARFTASIEISFALTMTLSPIFAVTLEITRLSISAPVPPIRPPARVFTRPLNFAV